MNPLTKPFTAPQRDTLVSTSEMLALLPIPNSRDLSTRLDCIAQTRRPDAEQLAAAITLATAVHRRLLMDASPDRWIDEVSVFDAAQQGDIIADLIAQRRAQAEQVSHCLEILRPVSATHSALT